MRLLIAADDFHAEDALLGDDNFEDLVSGSGDQIDSLVSSSTDSKQGVTRRIARTMTIRDNHIDQTARVRVTLMHQRRRPGPAADEDDWEDADSFKLSSLRANEQVKLDLGPNQTKQLFVSLVTRFRQVGTLQEILGESGFRVVGKDEITVQGREKDILERLLAEDQNFWEHLEKLRPDILTAVALNKQHEMRKQALALFSERMNDRVWSEDDWDYFFRKNRWIFGYGLSYCFLRSVQSQPHYGGTTLSGQGGERGDFLMATEASAKFTVLVEIKLPNAPLLSPSPYRGSKTFHASKEVNGGVAQLQANCATWFREGSRNPDTHVDLLRQGIHTHEPKAILVVGNTVELGQDSGKIGSFERYRRSLKNPEIITYDELYERAAHLIATDFDKAEADSSATEEDWLWDEDAEPAF